MTPSREWQLARHPEGRPVDDDVALVTVDVPDPGPGELLVRNVVMSVEPYMRGRMAAGTSYAEHYRIGEPMTGHAVGRVVASRHPAVPEGSWVLHEAGWREYASVRGEDATVVDVGPVPASAHLGVLGLTGFTAWVGLTRTAGLQPGETVLVTSAAGAVGSAAGQLAKARGATVIGSAGGPAKVARLVGDLGFDAAFDHREGPVRDALAAAMARAGADGVDVFFDNVGGEQLEAGIRVMNTFGRIALCGAISVYNSTEPVPGPRNLLLMIWRRLRMEGFLLADHEDDRAGFLAEMTPLVAAGTVRQLETVTQGGIEQAWPAFLAMLDGAHVGKSVVALASTEE
ncbi:MULTISPECIES: NADP-dependent oxidoreductase [unclassified Blastococcus]